MSSDATGPTCVYVVGMHRSGTSATAGVLAKLGLGTPRDEDLVPAEQSNERGHWESRSVVRLNNRLLRHLGGTWSTPALLTSGWERDPSLDEWRSEAKGLLESSFTARPIVFKDPRNCITLPFWQTVVEPPVAAVFVFRDPTEVAQSLGERSGLRMIHGLAMWERHVRAAANNLEGLPTLSGDYAAAMEDPKSWCNDLVSFLGEVGVEVSPQSRAEAVAFLDTAMHHQRPHPASDGPPDSARTVYESLVATQGMHRSWKAPDVGEEPEWVGDVLELTNELEQLKISHASLKRSRAFRMANIFWRFRE